MSEIATPPVVQTDAGLIARLGAQKQKFKAAWTALKERSDLLDKQVKDLTEQNTQLLNKTDVSAAAKRVDELTAELRGLKHRAAFDTLALKSGAQPGALEDLWKLSEVEAKSDEPDATALQKVIDDQKAARAWAFNAEPPPPPDPNAPPPLKPAAGSGKGGAAGTPAVFSEDQLSDPKFVMANFARISAAASERVAAGQV